MVGGVKIEEKVMMDTGMKCADMGKGGVKINADVLYGRPLN